MADLLTDLNKYLVALPANHPICTQAGGVLTFGTNFFIGQEPDVVPATACITLYPTGGYGMDKQNLTTYPTIQLRVRVKDWKRGYDLTNAVIEDWHSNSKMLASTNAVCFTIQSQANYLGPMPDVQAHLFSCNFYWAMVRYSKIRK